MVLPSKACFPISNLFVSGSSQSLILAGSPLGDNQISSSSSSGRRVPSTVSHTWALNSDIH